MLPKLSFFKKQKILILTHSGADVDAIASAAALFFCLKKNNFVSIGIPEHVSQSAKTFAEKMKIPYKINPAPKEFGILILVDFNSWEMLGKMQPEVKNFGGKIFLLDHHSKTNSKIAPAKNTLIGDSCIAASEIVFDWIKKSRFPIDSKIAACIACGIIEDSAHFTTADKRTFPIMAKCLEKSRKNLDELVSLSRLPLDLSKKIAMLKSAERAELYEAGEFLIALSHVGSFEAEAATALIRNGADLAFVGNSEKGILKISGRASGHIVHAAKISLAENIFEELGKFFEGSGGGHAAAAAFNGKGENIEEALQKCLSLSTEFLKAKNPAIEAKKL